MIKAVRVLFDNKDQEPALTSHLRPYKWDSECQGLCRNACIRDDVIQQGANEVTALLGSLIQTRLHVILPYVTLAPDIREIKSQLLDHCIGEEIDYQSISCNTALTQEWSLTVTLNAVSI